MSAKIALVSGGFMLNVLIGIAAVIVSAFAFWSVLPVGGKINAKIAPAWEPYIAIGIVFLLGLGLGLMVTGAYDILT
jgi:hypothetical protein